MRRLGEDRLTYCYLAHGEKNTEKLRNIEVLSPQGQGGVFQASNPDNEACRRQYFSSRIAVSQVHNLGLGEKEPLAACL